jgi:F420-dependent oxidoreductase-like protein
MRIGLMGSTDGEGALATLAEQARVVRDAGFSTLWTSQIFGYDALTALAVVGREVPDVELGTAVVPTYPRHPVMLAQQALTVQALTGNRLCLGIGLSHQIVVEAVWGMSFAKPVRHMREYLSVLMPLLESGKVAFQGEEYRVNAGVRCPGGERPSVVVAALGEQMLRVAGSLADGTSTWCTGPTTLRDHIVPTLRQAAADAGRPAPRVVAALPVAVTSDVDGTKRRTGQQLAMYNTLPSYRTMMDKEGVAGPADLAIAGTAAEVRDRLAELSAIGVTDFNAAIVAADPDERAATMEVLRDVS